MNIVKLYVRVIGLLLPEKPLVIALLVSALVIAVAQFAEPVLFGRIIDRLGKASAQDAWTAIAPLALLWVGFGLFNVLASAMQALKADQLSHRQRLSVMSRFFEHLLELPQSYHQANHTGRLLKIMLDGSAGISNVWLTFLRENAVSFLALLCLLPATLFLNWRLALLLILLVFLSACVIAYVIQSTQDRQQKVESYHTEIAERAADAIGNVPVVQSFTRTRAEAEDLRKIGMGYLLAQMPILSWWAATTVITRASATTTVLLIFLTGAWLHTKQLASIGEIVTFIGLATLCIGKLEQVIGFLNWLFLLAPKLQEFFDVLDTAPSIANRSEAIAVGHLRGEICFENVSYSHDGSRPAIDGVTFTIKPGEIVALVGETGSGKSTTAAALYRAFDPDNGRITIDGIDIADMEINSLRSNIGIVFQEPMLFARTIEENLRVAKIDATVDQLRFALQEAQALNFVDRLEKGLETRIGERGTTLSGGERQRLSVARALLKNPSILILDEATSALDVSTEAALQRALERAMKDRTVLIIAHRLSTVRTADRIIVLKDGKIAEQGSFDELMRNEGPFAQFVEKQLL